MPNLLLRFFIAITTPVARDERGQTTAEYALVLLAAAVIAGVVITWAKNTSTISRLFDSVVKEIMPG